MGGMINPECEPRPIAIRCLRRHDLFASLSDSQWLRLESRMRLQHLASGHPLFFRGEPATAFYLVCAGGIKLFRSSPQGLEKVMRVVHAGRSFAESVLFSDPPLYPVDAEAIEASTVVAIAREAYLATLHESFSACREVMARMVERIHAHRDEIEMLNLPNSRARVSRYLFGLYAEDDAADGRLRLPGSRGLIAAQLGLAPETLSRTLHGLRKSGLIDVRRETIHIRDTEALRRYARLQPVQSP